VHRDTHRVALLPADEWTDTPRDWLWLPSFVLPRDPAVTRVLGLAERYVAAITDDPAAGFDGYQALDGSDPTAIDRQVRAIWWALIWDAPLAYVNPPPAYAKDAQRLRTPSMVLEGRRGTCIDLSLLLAACLEYVEIYPVILLFRDHACVGYWRSPGAHDAFLELRDVEHRVTVPAGDGAGGSVEESRSLSSPREPFLCLRDAFPEIRREIRAGNLVPLEATLLPARASFAQGMEDGVENLARLGDFQAMLDVVAARNAGITPIPIGGVSP